VLRAEPLLFLDYVAMSHDDPPVLEQLVKGVSDGCILADCALLGGETAIMPDLYQRGDYDLAGFCVGVVERKQLIDGKAIVPGDLLLGVASSGLHSNGYSLVRKVVFELAGLDVQDHVECLGTTVGEALLTPTRSTLKRFAKSCSTTRSSPSYTDWPTSPRRSARQLGAHSADSHAGPIDAGSWPVPACFRGCSDWRHRRRRDGPRLQHGHRAGAGGQPVLRGEHPADADRPQTGQLADRPNPARRLTTLRQPLPGQPARALVARGLKLRRLEGQLVARNREPPPLVPAFPVRIQGALDVMRHDAACSSTEKVPKYAP